ncbi:flagellar basal body L-ring protein FlgH [Sulfitobacter sp. CW3]|uniref:flagellar basal body L-ring protein FlgH n=1 Tax=Sulfitobacter sp. CW3 TaxID=2861965 RepID=UPI001C5EB124|nr:flagellar basal body L-ring protein FlgH [Sulfitobacter sp. CW3]MBW4961661.1 flagellar basal body L-ring protein FlgH [Sulfitobacter sp. CW3]
MTSLRSHTTALFIGSALVLTGCNASKHFDREPRTSDLVVDGDTIPEVARVQVPMPAVTMAAPRTGSARASLFSNMREPLFADQRADDVGDIVTVIISIDDSAQLSNSTDRQRDGGSTIGFPTFFGYGAKIASILPGISRDDLPTGDIVDINSQTQASGSGAINRNEQVDLKVAALVIEKLPNGTLVVAGRQEIKVNHELRELRMAGIVRPADIRNDNTISYEKIAEARVAYGGRGTISRTQQRSYGEDALDVILPY